MIKKKLCHNFGSDSDVCCAGTVLGPLIALIILTIVIIPNNNVREPDMIPTIIDSNKKINPSARNAKNSPKSSTVPPLIAKNILNARKVINPNIIVKIPVPIPYFFIVLFH